MIKKEQIFKLNSLLSTKMEYVMADPRTDENKLLEVYEKLFTRTNDFQE